MRVFSRAEAIEPRSPTEIPTPRIKTTLVRFGKCVEEACLFPRESRLARKDLQTESLDLRCTHKEGADLNPKSPIYCLHCSSFYGLTKILSLASYNNVTQTKELRWRLKGATMETAGRSYDVESFAGCRSQVRGPMQRRSQGWQCSPQEASHHAHSTSSRNNVHVETQMQIHVQGWTPGNLCSYGVRDFIRLYALSFRGALYRRG